MTELRISVANGIDEVSPADWDACANPGSDSAVLQDAIASSVDAQCEPRGNGASATLKLDQKIAYNPFLSHDFLSALEASHSVGGRTGWLPRHVLAQTPDGTLVAAAPCYLKSHSRGEYVFDGGWGEAYERAGGSYYPKLQVAAPFTPATGRRLLVRGDQADKEAIRR